MLDAPASVDSENGGKKCWMKGREETVVVTMMPLIHLCCCCGYCHLGHCRCCCQSSSSLVSSFFTFAFPFSSFFGASSFFVVFISSLISSFLLASALLSSFLMSCGSRHGCLGCSVSSSFVVPDDCPLLSSLSLLLTSLYGLWRKTSSSSPFLLPVESFGDDFQTRTRLLISSGCC